MAKNKYLNGILPMFLINFAIGSVYCWTLFKEAIWDYTGFGHGVTEWSFSLAIFFLGMSAAFGGRIVEANPNRSAWLTFAFFTTGWLVTGFGIQTRTAWVTVVGFGVIQGIGLGLGYLTPVKTMMIWLGNRKGFAAGLSIAAFGLAGVLINPLVGFLLRIMTVYAAFYTLAVVFGLGLIAAALLIFRPAYDDQMSVEEAHASFNVRDILLNRRFLLLWAVFFLNIVGGLAMISQEKQLYVATGVDQAAWIIVVFTMITAGGNLIGRLGMASWQDKLNAKFIPYFVMLIGSIVMSLVAALAGYSVPVVVTLVFVIQFFLGTGFSCMPNILHQNWGLRYLSTVHGFVLSAWAVAGLVGNQFARYMMNHFELRALYGALAAIYTVALACLVVWVLTTQRGRNSLAGDDAAANPPLPATLAVG